MRTWTIRLLLASAPALLSSTLAAETYVVTRTEDDSGTCEADDCSLREAILAANARPGFDTILVPKGFYPIEIPGGIEETDAGSFDIRDDVEIIGEPGTHIDGQGLDRVFYIGGCTGTLRNLIISGGATPEFGAGVYATLGDVRIFDSIIRDNRDAFGGGGVGALNGGIHIERSAVLDNQALVEGGGVFRFSFGAIDPVVILNSTISGNSAVVGGGVRIDGEATLEIRGSTIANNTASLQASAVSTSQIPPVTISNTLIVGGCGFSLVPDSEGGNLESPGSNCLFSHPSDRMGVADAGLGSLDFHGGPTPSYILLPQSPALDSGLNSSCTTLDQRGFPRPQDGDGDGEATCDVGAHEFLPGGVSVAIPALSGWGLWFFALALLSVGWRVIAKG